MVVVYSELDETSNQYNYSSNLEVECWHDVYIYRAYLKKLLMIYNRWHIDNTQNLTQDALHDISLNFFTSVSLFSGVIDVHDIILQVAPQVGLDAHSFICEKLIRMSILFIELTENQLFIVCYCSHE